MQMFEIVSLEGAHALLCLKIFFKCRNIFLLLTFFLIVVMLLSHFDNDTNSKGFLKRIDKKRIEKSGSAAVTVDLMSGWFVPASPPGGRGPRPRSCLQFLDRLEHSLLFGLWLVLRLLCWSSAMVSTDDWGRQQQLFSVIGFLVKFTLTFAVRWKK